MKGIVLTTRGEIKITDFSKKELLKTAYEQIGTDIVEAVDTKTKRNEIPITIWCDEEGLLKGTPKVTARTSDGKLQIVGNIFITPQDMDEEGYVGRGFNEDELEQITNEIPTWIDQHGVRKMLFVTLGD